MNKIALRFAPLLLIASIGPAWAIDPASFASLKQGGHVIIFRHVATDDSQKDIYPFRFDDMKAQRQLSDKGRSAARAIGASLKTLGVPLGEIYTSRLNRAVETGKLLADKDVIPRDELTDSGAGSASKMANPDGDNEKIGRAIRDLVNNAPKAGANNVVVTHKTNVADAFGKDFADVQEGEALVYRPAASGPVLVVRVKADAWQTDVASK
ncbi:histidine phosphatase family protein [Bradyrhizobium sp. LHD-71]|uniref:histidine phosphatase family protein n=1 Tax=Bradyrhizobium sp. LHD-71 TaxID=3072141 RepID=UPI00280F88AB|nr:histidine phosphatase family protein [Bradyrhizobium sp. LHD-71]MDQ8729496.1 histidine phosphatase family protein [Bradyrhizobium sp. LHD-71]